MRKTLGTVGGAVVVPLLARFNEKSAKIGENNDWAGTAKRSAAFTRVGALPAATSKDAARPVALPPGLYPVEAGGVNATTGIALVEVYEVP